MGKKILIIEDDADMARLLAIKLKAEEYEVINAQDPMSGLSMAHKINPDIVILDLTMSAGGGIFFLDKVANSMNTNMISVIVTSGTKDPALIRKVSDKGVQFVSKPYNLDELISKIKLILDGSIVSIPKITSV